jgi:hypothetical protein
MGFTSIQNLVADNGSVANFKSWAMAISAFFTTCGWTQTADTGQVNWATGTVVAITAASFSGGNTTYTYTLTSGTPLLVGQAPVIAGMVASGNNGTFTIATLTGTLTAGTFIVANASGVNATAQSGTGTAPFAVPGSSTTVFEIWQPAADALQTGATAYYLKIQYGNFSTSNSPVMEISIGTATTGAGGLSGFIAGPWSLPTGLTSGAGPATFECDFCGDVDRMGMILWRNNSTGNQVGFFCVERTKTTSGTNSSDGVTLFSSSFISINQRTIEFGIGLGPALTVIVGIDANTQASLISNNSAPISPTFALYGKWSNPQTVLGLVSRGDCLEGMVLTTTLYGSTRTYLASKANGINSLGASGVMAPVLRWD